MKTFQTCLTDDGTDPVSASGGAHRAFAAGSEHKFHLATLMFRRAKQLQEGSRPRVPRDGHKYPLVALLEVMAGLVPFSVAEAEVGVPSAATR